MVASCARAANCRGITLISLYFYDNSIIFLSHLLGHLHLLRFPPTPPLVRLVPCLHVRCLLLRRWMAPSVPYPPLIGAAVAYNRKFQAPAGHKVLSSSPQHCASSLQAQTERRLVRRLLLLLFSPAAHVQMKAATAMLGG